MKKILVTGCNGQLGRAIQKEYGDSVEFILTDVVEGEGIFSLDITNEKEVLAFCPPGAARRDHQLRGPHQCGCL